MIETLHRRRIYMLSFVLLLGFGLVNGRLLDLHVDPDERLNQPRNSYEVDPRARGEIRDRNGDVLATNLYTHFLTADPSRIEDADAVLEYLSARITLNEDEVRPRLLQTNANGNKRKSIVVRNHLTDEEIKALDGYKTHPAGKHLHIGKDMQRFYPNDQLAAHVLGFTTDGQGREGVERRADKFLRSAPGKRSGRVDKDRKLLGLFTLEQELPTGGENVYLTIDRDLQYHLELAIDKAMEERQAPEAMGILMDPYTGAILALACRPAFDPNQYSQFSSHIRRNKAVVDYFEPGSSIKIITASAALELGLVGPYTQIDCEGGQMPKPGGRTLYDTHPRNKITFTQSFAESSNIALVKIAQQLRPEAVEEWMRRFGIGQRSGVGLPQETQGILRPASKWSRLSIYNVPIGQEMAVNLVQLARAFSVIANGGYLVQPHLVGRAVDAEGETTYAFSQADRPRVISEATANTMKQVLHAVVVGKESTGRRAAIQDFRVGAKTGTGQITDPETRSYFKRKYTAVIGGFAPLSSPRLTCVIVVSKPKFGEHHGGRASGPVFKEIMTYALNKLNVPKDPMSHEDSLKEYVTLASLDGQTLARKNKFEIFESNDEEDFFGELEPEAAQGDLAHGDSVLPNLKGRTKRQARQTLAALGVAWDPRGAGRVVEQVPPPGTPLKDVTVCQLVFSHESSVARNNS